ncbi:hypothetical protein OC188_01610 [Anaplasma capra]|uniref:hypothetical protein n=1 Tax=Anaplasma capra TaxID=1562740 RepID=UPI0021D6127B|nr:hypothetical protein [Anaplasma capra]MCU7611396.1 hypothetical protein [Anaplasma capra]
MDDTRGTAGKSEGQVRGSSTHSGADGTADVHGALSEGGPSDSCENGEGEGLCMPEGGADGADSWSAGVLGDGSGRSPSTALQSGVAVEPQQVQFQGAQSVAVSA